ncbi:hypothetical protein MNQ96_02790 [Sphingopyxis granuli]|uniref:DoxX family protein n=1 Tax=Sphingopyxis granuli TaxID=267128 RepID=UPI001F535B3D|nr:hypothetical protein [Sphingopyxis granuli]UNK80042.1 hypothetical protein MNQ96_02790 [Sphingopyxis granuli]
MIFFIMLAMITAISCLVQFIGSGSVAVPSAMQWGMSLSLIFFGIDHLRTPGRYLPMLPAIVPAPRKVVLVTGLCELAGAIGLAIPALRNPAAWALAVYFVCVFPANIKNAIKCLDADGLPSARAYYWFRLLLQPIAVWWPLYAAEITSWPFK